MIRVNLLKDLGFEPVGGAGLDIASVDLQKQAGKKLALILLFPALLMAYEKFNVSGIESETEAIQRQAQSIQAENAQYGDIGPRVAQYTKEKEKIMRELNVVKGLTEPRLRELKALDQLQSLVPQATWLKKFTMKGNSVVMTGYSTSSERISELIGALDNSPFFSEVIPKGTQQVQLQSAASASQFEVEFYIGQREATGQGINGSAPKPGEVPR